MASSSAQQLGASGAALWTASEASITARDARNTTAWLLAAAAAAAAADSAVTVAAAAAPPLLELLAGPPPLQLACYDALSTSLSNPSTAPCL